MVLKSLQKNAVKAVSLTGHELEISQQGDAKHGFRVQPEAGKVFAFFVTEKKAPKQYTSGNAMRPFVLNSKELGDNFGWLWKMAYDSTHCRLVPKKPCLTVKVDLKLEADKPVAVSK